MQKSIISPMLILIFILSMSTVSAADPVSFTSDQVINATDLVLSYVDENNTLPVDVNISGSVVDMPQFLELLTTVVLNINSTSNDLINLGSYGNATNSSENITNSSLNSTEYLDIAKRVKDLWILMDVHLIMLLKQVLGIP